MHKLLLLAATPNVATAVPAVFLVGTASILYLTASTAIVQVEARPEMHGRVLSLQTVVLIGTVPVGGPFLGWLADTLGGRARRWWPAASSVSWQPCSGGGRVGAQPGTRSISTTARGVGGSSPSRTVRVRVRALAPSGGAGRKLSWSTRSRLPRPLAAPVSS